jgi:hypothetical protein
MSVSSGERLLRALLAERGEPDAAASDADRAFARQLIAARSADQSAPACPPGTRQRAYALFEQLPAGLFETLAQLVFDSWQSLAPAARSLGTERLLRFECPMAALDVQIARDEVEEALTVAVAVEGGTEDRRVEVVIEGGARPVTLSLDEDGAGSARIPGDVREVVVVVRDEDGELLRTPALVVEN